MDQNTSDKKSAVKASTTVDAKPAFNISNYFNSTALHVAVEVVIACAFFAYFNRKINNQKDKYEERITTLETHVQSLVAAVNELIGAGMQKKFVVPSPEPQKAAPAAQQAPKKTSMPLNLFQDLIVGSMAMFDAKASPPPTNLSTIEEVVEESDEEVEVSKKPVSREQLDKELSEELGELVNKNE